MSAVVAGLFEVFAVYPSVVPVLLGLMVIGFEVYTMFGRKFAKFAIRHRTVPYFLFLVPVLAAKNNYVYIYAVYIALQMLYGIVNGEYVVSYYRVDGEILTSSQ